VVVGLLLGRLIRPIALALDQVPPRVGWPPVLALGLAAVIMGGAAWLTHRARQRERLRLLSHHQAVNRLVLAKACSLAGAVVVGVYAGYALSWVGAHAELGEERLLHSVLAAGAAAALVVSSLTLEQACRVDENKE
jgi:hypothetical protein